MAARHAISSAADCSAWPINNPPRKNRMRSAGSILAVKAWLQIGQLAELTAHSEGGGAWFIHRRTVD
jgi:hypothetical protein